jgi:RNA polymerase sigma factor (TIGR02999 family)
MTKKSESIAITELLQRVGAGEHGMDELLYRAVYADLQRIAHKQIYECGQFAIIDSPALVNEAYLRLAGREGSLAGNRRIFFGYASKVMRNIIVDAIKEATAAKRGGGLSNVTLATGIAGVTVQDDGLEHLAQALDRLQRLDARACELVELRYFGGLTLPECAEHLGISTATASRDWEKARQFLAEELG